MQRIGTRLDALDRLSKFEGRAKYADWSRKQGASDRIWDALHVAWPTAPMVRRLSANGKFYLLESAPKDSPSFEAGLQAFFTRVEADAMTDSDRALLASLADDFAIIGFDGVKYVTALASVLSEF